MKATLEFELPDDRSEYVQATHGPDFWHALYDVRSAIRDFERHGTRTADELISYIRCTIDDTPGFVEVE